MFNGDGIRHAFINLAPETLARQPKSASKNYRIYDIFTNLPLSPAQPKHHPTIVLASEGADGPSEFGDCFWAVISGLAAAPPPLRSRAPAQSA